MYDDSNQIIIDQLKDKIGEIFDVTVNEEFDDIYDLTDEEFEKVRSSKNSDETTLGFYISADDCLKL